MKKLREFWLNKRSTVGYATSSVPENEQSILAREVDPAFDALVLEMVEQARSINEHLATRKIYDKTGGGHVRIHEFMNLTEILEKYDAYVRGEKE